jgi:translation initiation factor IF-3
MKDKKKKHLINEEIKQTQVRVTEVGLLSIDEALGMAKSQDMDLVLFNVDNNDIGICKIMKYEKYIYELNKANKQKKVELKEIKIGPNTSDNDLNYRINHVTEFLKKGHKVKLTMEFRGREMNYVEKGNALFLNLLVKLEEVAVPEFLPKIEGKKLYTMLRPKTK